MSKIIESNYQGKYNTSTKTPLSDEEIKVDLKFGPIDLLMGSYGSCMLGTVDFYARKKGFEVNGSKSEISYEMATEGGKVGTINVKLSFDKEYPADQKEIIETSAKNLCHVGNSLNPSIVRNYEFVYGA
ncbi:TPA: OsmC family protein [Elizabethkingia anophelis]|nr:OsmC family protein [Elizabethkingia anophelis]HBN6707262.1 OsmC family protein [Elizabethkingia anophelis]HBN6711296.1 OsmC family protein [Elizabethkingia anophelis]HBN6714082.1 OsmC family protein [Elizabethkingia anophelis]HBN6719620.1 OsmC family protein [Elizabethkingia anophelis]